MRCGKSFDWNGQKKIQRIKLQRFKLQRIMDQRIKRLQRIKIRNLTVSNLGESTFLSKRRWLLHLLSKRRRRVFLPLCQKILLFLSESKCSSQELLDENDLSPKFDTVKFLANLRNVVSHNSN